MYSNKDILIDIADEDSISAIFKMTLEMNLSSWSLADYINELGRNDSIFLAAKVEDETVGFLVSRLIINDETQIAEIYNIGVGEKYRRNKVGQNLILYLFNICKDKSINEIWLEVRASSTGASTFYRKIGFENQYVRKNFYTNPPEDAFVMKRSFT